METLARRYIPDSVLQDALSNDYLREFVRTLVFLQMNSLEGPGQVTEFSKTLFGDGRDGSRVHVRYQVNITSEKVVAQ